MYRYVAYYKIESTPKIKPNDVAEINDIFDKGQDFNPMINEVFHSCVSSRMWDDVPLVLDSKVKGWNWKLKDEANGYVEILTEEPLTDDELDIMANETYGQICDGYNENAFRFKLSNGHKYEVLFSTYPYKDFAEE